MQYSCIPNTTSTRLLQGLLSPPRVSEWVARREPQDNVIYNTTSDFTTGRSTRGMVALLPGVRPRVSSSCSLRMMLQEILGWDAYSRMCPKNGWVNLVGISSDWRTEEEQDAHANALEESLFKTRFKTVAHLHDSAFREGIQLLTIPLRQGRAPNMASRALGLQPVGGTRVSSWEKAELNAIRLLACYPPLK